MSLFLMYFVRLSVDQAWMAFRAGQMMIIGLAALTARFVAASTSGAARHDSRRDRRCSRSSCGAPTTIIDEYNAQDIHNLAMGPGFPWTIVVTAAAAAGLRLDSRQHAETAVVQMDARVA